MGIVHPMNSKQAANALIVVCLLVSAAWFWWPVPPPKDTAVVRLRPATAPLAPPMAPQLSPPDETEPAAASPPPVFDPQSDLKTAVPDLIRLATAGDFPTLLQNYMPPDALAGMSAEEKAATLQGIQAEAQSTEGQQEMIFMLTAAPTYDATGNRATYTFPGSNPTRPSLTFVRLNGRWYIE